MYDKQDYPFTVQFGIVDGCNQNCKFCGMSGRAKTIHMTEYGVVERLVRMLKEAQFKGRIRLDLYGEPTLHKEFYNIVHYIHTELPECHITLFTNGFGIYNKGHSIDDYFGAGIGDIIFDVYDSTLKEYNNSEIPKNEYTVINNTNTPFFVKKKRILVNLPIENQQEIKTRKFVNHCGAGSPALKEPLCAKCAHPFRDFTVNSYGEIMLCCNDFRGEYICGTIFDYNSFDEAWNNPRLQSARKMLYNKDRTFNPCKKCDSKSHRVGLLPDLLGKKELETPTNRDREIVEYNWSSNYIKIVPREWENYEHNN